MGKALAIGEVIIILKELWEGTSDIFSENIPNELYTTMDKLAFLTSKFLGFDSSGNFFDKTNKIGEAIMNLSNMFIWGILLFYGFKSLFGYFLSKKVDIPWKFFIRMIIFGVLANASFFICYTGVFLTENCTEYIRCYVGEDNISFSFLEDYLEEDIDENTDENKDIYTLDVLLSAFTYFSVFLTAVFLGGRYIVVKVLILVSPIFFVFGGFRESEKIFYKWCKKFFLLLFLQIIFCTVLGTFNFVNIENEMIIEILICSILYILSKNMWKFLNLSF